MDSAIKGNINGNHVKKQRKKWPWENQQFEDKDRVFVSQDSILRDQDLILLCKEDKDFKQSMERRISREYSLKDRSFKAKTRSLPFCNGFFKILGTRVYG